jgi:hypothetical protein
MPCDDQCSASWHFRRHRATSGDGSVASYKRGVTGSNPVAPTKFSQLDGLFETLIGDPVTTAGNHRCMLPDGERVPGGHGSIPLDHQGRAVRRRQAPPALERRAGLKDPRRSASLLHACIVVSLMAGVRPEEARAIGWAEDVDLDGNPPSVAVLRADRAGEDTKTPRSRRALKLAQMAVGAHHGHRYTAGCQAHPEDVPGRFRESRARQGLGAAGPAAHVRLSTSFSAGGVPVEEIARLAGYQQTSTTELVRPDAGVGLRSYGRRRLQRPRGWRPGQRRRRRAGAAAVLSRRGGTIAVGNRSASGEGTREC